MSGLSLEATIWKLISTLFLSPGRTARKTFLEKVPATQVAMITLPALLEQSGHTIAGERSRIPDRVRSFCRKQKLRESLYQFRKSSVASHQCVNLDSIRTNCYTTFLIWRCKIGIAGMSIQWPEKQHKRSIQTAASEKHLKKQTPNGKINFKGSPNPFWFGRSQLQVFTLWNQPLIQF